MGLFGGQMDDLARMAGAVQHRAGNDRQRINVHAEAFDRGPVDDQTVDFAFLEHAVFDADLRKRYCEHRV